MAVPSVALGSGTLDQVDFATVCAEAMKASIANQNWPQLYPEEVYRQAGSMEGRVCKCLFDGPFRDRQACLGETNAVMAILKAEIVGPLSQIPNLHKRVFAKVWEPGLGDEIASVFRNRIRFLAPPPDEALGDRILKHRDEVRTRVFNLMMSQFKPLMEDIVKFYQRHLSFDKPKAIASVVGCRYSIADTVACWTLYCIAKGLVNGDGTYTGREMVKEAPGLVTAWRR